MKTKKTTKRGLLLMLGKEKFVREFHKKENLTFKAMSVTDFHYNRFDYKYMLHKSPSYRGRQSSEYYLAIDEDCEGVFYVRKANHWGHFSCKSNRWDESCESYENDWKTWNLIGGNENAHISQVGVIKLGTVAEIAEKLNVIIKE